MLHAPLPPISIHALREEGDGGGVLHAPLPPISIHALREEGDHDAIVDYRADGRFLSTPSARRATNKLLCAADEPGYFYPRPPRGGRLSQELLRSKRNCISIHALREEGDSTPITGAVWMRQFLSTPSARRATALLFLRPASLMHFYPRPPRGGRQALVQHSAMSVAFLSTPSARRATYCTTAGGDGQHYFYPRPPRGGRRLFHVKVFDETNFYPRPPRGGRPLCSAADAGLYLISIHALREEGDVEDLPEGWSDETFLSTPSARRATRFYGLPTERATFLSTPSARRATCLRLSSQVRNSNFYPRPPRGGRLRP